MSEMVERVARHTWEAWRTLDIAAESCRDLSWDEVVALCDAAPLANGHQPAKQIVEAARSQARTAIAAMREPTEAMWQSWRSVNCTLGTGGFEEFTHFDGDYGNWLACHHKMIDEALK